MTQMFFVIGALILLGSAILGINQMLLIKTTTMLDAEASLAATSIGQTMLDEIMAKNYDSATDTGYGVDLKKVFDVNLFTAPGALGCNSTEASKVPLPDTADVSGIFRSAKFYNDVDDYNGYRRTVKTPVLGDFTVVDSVYYTDEINPDLKSNVRTYYKKIVVIITHRNMERRLSMSDVAVYRRYF